MHVKACQSAAVSCISMRICVHSAVPSTSITVKPLHPFTPSIRLLCLKPEKYQIIKNKLTQFCDQALRSLRWRPLDLARYRHSLREFCSLECLRSWLINDIYSKSFDAATLFHRPERTFEGKKRKHKHCSKQCSLLGEMRPSPSFCTHKHIQGRQHISKCDRPKELHCCK